MSDECYTPREYVEAARDVMGGIDLDPASCKQANAIVRAARYFTAAMNGLLRRWKGRVWLNCPFSDPLSWARVLIKHYQAGHVTECVSLWNSRTGSQWFDLMSRHGWRCEVKRRIRFWGPGTASSEGKGNGRQDQVFFYFGPRPERFAARFAAFGRIVPPITDLASSRTCAVCTRSLEGRRRHSEVCSSRCRQRRLRQRWAAENVAVSVADK